jgi:RHS repeat-associated protein
MKAWMASGLLLALSLTVPVHAARTFTSVLTNAQGTVVAEMDVQGNVTYEATYRPYGQQQTGAPQAGPGYTGHVNDPDTGLVYMQARYYDAGGHFLSVDPVGATPGNIFNINRYAYANDNPIRFVDPEGRKCREASDGNSGGCWNTPQESKAAERGDWRAYYHLAGDKGNDPYAKHAGNVAANSGKGLEGLLDQATNTLLKQAIVKSLAPVVPSKTIVHQQVANTMEHIRVGLVRARVNFLKSHNATSSHPVQMTRRDVTNFHRAVFESNGVPGSAFGGTIFDSMFGSAGRSVYDWCPPPSCSSGP